MLSRPPDDVSLMAMSIMDFVIDNPEIRDVVIAYNKWAKLPQTRFPLHIPEYSLMALNFFNVNINLNTRKQLLECQSIDAEQNTK